MLTQQLAGEPGVAPQNSSVQAPDSSVPASVVIQPISGLSLQPTVTSANLTIGPLSEHDSVLTTSSSGKWAGLLHPGWSPTGVTRDTVTACGLTSQPWPCYEGVRIDCCLISSLFKIAVKRVWYKMGKCVLLKLDFVLLCNTQGHKTSRRW